SQLVGQPFTFSPNVVLGGQPTDNIQVDLPPVVDPTIPRFFPNAAAGGTTQQGTQPTGTQATNPGTTPQGTQPNGTQATNPGSTPQGSASATQGGTVR